MRTIVVTYVRDMAASLDESTDPSTALSGTAPTDRGVAAAAAIAEVGYVVMEDIIDPVRCDQLVGDLERIEAEMAIGPGDNGFEGFATVRIYNLLTHGALYEAIATEPAVLDVVERVLDRGCLVSSLSSIAIGPGERAQPIHADDQLLPLPKPHVPIVCNTMWALTDFTAENGATRLVPGTHLADHDPDFGGAYETVAATMRKGSVLVWNGSLWHGGGANSTESRRYGIAMNYCAGWVRQQENQQLGIPLDVARGFSKRLRELAGFGIYNGLVGHIVKQSPSTVVLDAAPGSAAAPTDPGLVWSAT